MLPTFAVALLWLGFAGSHMALSSLRLRPQIADRIGEQAFRGLYSLVAFAFFIPLVWIYFAHKHSGPWLWSVSAGFVLQGLLYILMGVAFVLLVAAFAQPSPASILGGKAVPKGVFRITRHPLLMGIATFGLVHLVPNGSLTDIVFFGGFVAFSLAGAWHQDLRKIAMETPGYREFCRATPFLPFSGQQTWTGIREMSPVVIGAGVVLTIVVRYFHSSLFG
jgi:uncharacterized membrane protein